jgi:methionine synthase II (cobalamin-independent)
MSKVVDFIKAWVVVVNGDPELFESEDEANEYCHKLVSEWSEIIPPRLVILSADCYLNSLL